MKNNQQKKIQNLQILGKADNTVAPGNMPYTGGTFTVIICAVVISALGAYVYKRNKDLKGI